MGKNFLAMTTPNPQNNSDFEIYITNSTAMQTHFTGPSQVSSSLKDSLKYLDERNRDIDIIQLPVKPCTLQSVTEKFYSDNVRLISHLNDHYYM